MNKNILFITESILQHNVFLLFDCIFSILYDIFLYDNKIHDKLYEIKKFYHRNPLHEFVKTSSKRRNGFIYSSDWIHYIGKNKYLLVKELLLSEE